MLSDKGYYFKTNPFKKNETWGKDVNHKSYTSN